MIAGLNEFTNFNAQMAGYLISDTDDTSNPKYYGFLDKFGNWYILRENTSTKTYRYCKGSNDYTTNWTNRASLTYDYVSVIFN